jgi:serine/threonine protein kinase
MGFNESALLLVDDNAYLRRLGTFHCKQGSRHGHYDIVHCDIKPANCLLEGNKGNLCLVIADFGISRIVSTSALQVKAFVASTLKGASFNYAAPEVMQRFRGQSVPNDPQVWQAGYLFALQITVLEDILQKN